MKRLFFIFTLLTCFLLQTAAGQAATGDEPDIFAGLKARSIGPANMSGRISDVAAVYSNPNIIYVGTATSGVWKTENGGMSWRPIFDEQPASSIGAIAIFQKNPNIVWVGTGESKPRNSAGLGRGVFKTLDGGKTWINLGLEKTEKISAIILDADNPDIAYVAALGTAWGENPDRGVFKTLDGGKTWKKILYVDEKTGVADLVVAPDNPNKLIAALWEFRRWPWFFKSGGPGSGLYITGDAGSTWKKLTAKEGLPKGDLGRTGLAFSTNSPNIAYALVEAEKSVLLRSQDGGLTWETVNDQPNISDRPFYYSRIRVNPLNENIVYMLQSELKVSEDGGKNFRELARWGQSHSDYHAMFNHPDGDQMIVGNDGGIVITYDRGKTWHFVQNLPLGQFYHVSFDMDIPYNVYGGLQDNGSWRGPGSTLVEGELADYLWKTVGGGDGFDTEPDPQDSSCGYGMSQGGNLYYFDVRTGLSQPIVPTESAVKHRYNWNAGFAVDPFAPTTIYLGSQFVHRSKDKGQTWEIISPDLTTNDPQKQEQEKSGGLTLDVTHAENHTTIVCIAPSPLQEGIIWVSTDDGHVQLTRDGGKNWELVSANIDKSVKKEQRVPSCTWSPQVDASKFDAASAFVVFDDHRRANWTPYIFVTHDFGKTWKSLATADIDGFVHTIEEDPVNKDLLFCGTEFGLFVSFNGGQKWQKWTAGLPTVPVTDLAIHPRDHDLIIGTHGRSIYIIDNIAPLREYSATISGQKLHFFKVADTYSFRQGRLSSFNSPGDTAYSGTNKATGAYLSYFLTPTPKKEKEKEPGLAPAMPEQQPAMMAGRMGRGRPGMMLPPGSTNVHITILDSEEKPVRTLSGTENKGINRVYWDLRREMPRSMTSGAEARYFGRGGLPVLPGTYTVKIKYDDQEQSQAFQVLNDPRLDIDTAVLKANYELGMQVMKLSFTLTGAEERINDTRKIIKTIAEFGLDPKAPPTEKILKAGQELDKMLKGLLDKIKADESKQGISDRNVPLSSQVRQLMFSMASSYKPVTQAMTVKHEKLKALVSEFFTELNKVYEVDVEAYKKLVQDSGFSLFKPFQPFKIEGKETFPPGRA